MDQRMVLLHWKASEKLPTKGTPTVVHAVHGFPTANEP